MINNLDVPFIITKCSQMQNKSPLNGKQNQNESF